MPNETDPAMAELEAFVSSNRPVSADPIMDELNAFAGQELSPYANEPQQDIEQPIAQEMPVDPLRTNAGQQVFRPPVEPQPYQAQSSIGERVFKDPLVSMGLGGVQAAQAVVGLADLVSGGYAGKGIEKLSGQTFKEREDYWNELYSKDQQEANRKTQEEQGFWNTVGAMVQNPSTIAHGAIQAMPTMLVSGGVAGKLAKVAPKLIKLSAGATEALPVVTGGAMEGVAQAGSMAESVRQQNESGLLTPKQTALSIASGVADGVIAVFGGKVAQKLGADQLNTLLAGGKTAEGIVKKQNIIVRAMVSALGEGSQEFLQSGGEQIAQNIATNKPWYEGVPNAMAMGSVIGMAMGSGAPLLGGKSKPPTLEDIATNVKVWKDTIKPPVEEAKRTSQSGSRTS